MPAVNIDTKGVGEAISGIGKSVIDVAKGVKTLVTGKLDPEKEQEFELQWAELEKAMMDQQAKINEVEAQSAKLFVAGWRPAAGWICVCGLGFEYLLRPLIQWFLSIFNVVTAEGVQVILPGIDMNMMFPLLGGLLGLGTMRGIEKIKGAQWRH